MDKILKHSPAPHDLVVVYNFVENELVALNEVFNLLFEKLEEQSTD